MGETNVATIASPSGVETKKSKKASSGVKKPKAKPVHPPTSLMVTNAIKSLKERGGSSLPAIKKYLAANYKVDAVKLAPFIKKYLKSAVASGTLIQTKGVGASGSFKLSKSGESGKPKGKSKSSGEKKKKVLGRKISGEKKRKSENSAESKKKLVSGVKRSEKKVASKAVAKIAKKSGEVKTKTHKQKPTKPSKKVAAKSPKVRKPKKSTTGTKKAVSKKPPAKK